MSPRLGSEKEWVAGGRCMVTSSLMVFIICSVSLLACADIRTQGQSSSLRDSAGILIVENRTPSWEPGRVWRVNPNPSVVLGALDGPEEYLFSDVNGVACLRDGRIVVANGDSRELRFYEADGTFLHAVGRDGQGPGEFRDLTLVGVTPEDSIVTWDRENNRFSVFSRQGDFIRTFTPRGHSLLIPSAVGLLRNGPVVREPEFFGGDHDAGLTQDLRAWAILDMSGQLLTDLGRLPGRMTYYQRPSSRVVSASAVLFGTQTVGAAGQDLLFLGDQESYEIRAHDSSGELVMLIRRQTSRLPVTDDEIGRFRQRRLEAAESEEARERMRRRWESLPLPELMPAYGELRVDPWGNLWVEVYPRPLLERAIWDVFGREGTYMGQVEMPEGLRVIQIGYDCVAGLFRDDLGVEYVHVHALRR